MNRLWLPFSHHQSWSLCMYQFRRQCFGSDVFDAFWPSLILSTRTPSIVVFTSIKLYNISETAQKITGSWWIRFAFISRSFPRHQPGVWEPPSQEVNKPRVILTINTLIFMFMVPVSSTLHIITITVFLTAQLLIFLIWDIWLRW